MTGARPAAGAHGWETRLDKKVGIRGWCTAVVQITYTDAQKWAALLDDSKDA